MLALILLAMAGELVRIGWYGSALLAVVAALTTMPWLWAFLAGFLVGRANRR